MRISEIYRSIQGESSYAGRPCTFVRTAGCSLRCAYCDTGYALSFESGTEQAIESVIAQIQQLGADLVEITGGEPLEEPNTPELCQRLLDLGATVLVETSGAFAIDVLPAQVIKIMDVKTPSSRMARRNHWDNLKLLSERDELKFVIANREDYDWSVAVCNDHALFGNYIIYFSPSFGVLDSVKLAQWILDDGIEARLQLQLHKYIWAPDAKGV
ncbi:MAG: radical SAM protein [Candidatus Hinthialibacter antarcticus]|nr:radical SAM protein [Candidatus Hinthialibacter antarcticus]